MAGAEWSPDIVERGATAAERVRFDRMLVHSWRRFSAQIGPRWGVTPRPIYEAEGVATGLDELPAEAATLFTDAAVVPIRGQLVHLRPQALPYLLDHPDGYVVPRSDALILGGSFEEGVSEAATDPATCARILDANRRFFRR